MLVFTQYYHLENLDSKYINSLTFRLILKLKNNLKKLFFILLAPLAIPMVLTIRFIRPWIHIRFGTFRIDRIGHYALDVGIQLAISSLNKGKFKEWYWLPNNTCNEQWSTMVRRHFYVRRWVEVLDFYNKNIPYGKLHQRTSTNTNSRDIHGYLEKANVEMDFLPDEVCQAQNWLESHGWKKGEKFVCLLVRDDGYLASNKTGYHQPIDWEYHDYRDSDIANYVQMVESLVYLGYWVLRMGKVMLKPFPFKHHKVIDYAFDESKNDLLDIWLFSKCYFVISTGSGPDSISGVYRRPRVFVNSLVTCHIHSWANNIWVPKHLIWKKSGKYLTLREHLKHNYLATEGYEKAGILIEELTSQEITDEVLQQEQRLSGSWIDTKEDLERQQKFWEIFKDWPQFSKLHGWVHPEARIGTHYLRNMGEAFFE